jgi:hypothetical protein
MLPASMPVPYPSSPTGSDSGRHSGTEIETKHDSNTKQQTTNKKKEEDRIIAYSI